VGGGTLVGASPSAQAAGAQVASGYTPGDTIPVSLSPLPPFSVSRQAGRQSIKIFTP
jgi:hypothetical protein